MEPNCPENGQQTDRACRVTYLRVFPKLFLCGRVCAIRARLFAYRVNFSYPPYPYDKTGVK